MPSKALQQILALVQQLEQVHSAPGAAGALPHPLVQADHKSGAGILLRQAGGHNAHHPLVPMLLSQKNDPRLGLSLQLPDTFLKNFTFNGLTLPVQGTQLLGQVGRPPRVPGEQQLCGQIGPTHPSRRIDPRGQGIANRHGSHRLFPQAGLLDQLRQAHPPGMGQVRQSRLNNAPVLPGHGHHIGHCPHGRQIGVLPEHQAGPVRSGHSHGQLQGHAHARQPLKGVRAVRPVWVHHSHRLGEDLLALVVVRDHHIHTQGTCKLHLPGRGDAAVHCDNQCHFLPRQGSYRLLIEAIALLQPVWNIGDHMPAQTGEAISQQTGGGNAVHIIVPIHSQGLLLLQRPSDAGDRLVQIRYSTGGENGRQQGRNSSAHQLGPPLWTGVGDFPLLISHCRRLLTTANFSSKGI